MIADLSIADVSKALGFDSVDELLRQPESELDRVRRVYLEAEQAAGVLDVVRSCEQELQQLQAARAARAARERAECSEQDAQDADGTEQQAEEPAAGTTLGLLLERLGAHNSMRLLAVAYLAGDGGCDSGAALLHDCIETMAACAATTASRA